MKEERTIDLWIFIEVILKWWRLIAFNIVVITFLAVIVSLVLPKKWTATTVILPPSASSASLSVEDIGSAYTLSSMALSALPGIISPSDIIAGMLDSETIKMKIIDRFNIMERYKIKRLDRAFEKVDQITDVSITKEQMVKIAVSTNSPEYSAQIANAFVEEIDRFNREVLMTTGKQFRIFLEERLNEAEAELRLAAESLKVFQEKHKVFSLEDETRKSIELLASLQGQVIAKKVQLNALKSYSYAGSPQITVLEKDIAALKKQLRELEYGTSLKKDEKGEEKGDFGVGFSIPLSKVPDVGLELTELEMNLQVKKTVYALLAEQYEKARIIESKNTPTITILDRARAPEMRSSPKRKRMVIMMFFMSIIYGFGLAVVFESIERIRSNKQNYARLFSIVDGFVNEVKMLLGKFRKRKV